MSRILVLCFVIGFTFAAIAADKPNVLFIFADDQAFSTIRELGNAEIETPNLDRMAQRGVTFTHTYNQGGWHGAICVASRTMLNTGRFLWHAKPERLPTDKERAEGRFWGPLMKKAGYRTYFTGKWHTQAKADQAFDIARHVRPGMPNQTPEGYNRPLLGEEDVWKPWDKSKNGFWSGGKHWSEIVADDAIDYIADAKQHGDPYFMYIAFNVPHDPRQSPKEYVDRYPLSKIAVPVNYKPLYPFKDAIGCSPSLRDEKLVPFPRTEFAVQVHRQEYYAIITHMDEQIGRILDAVEKSGEAENTYIIFTADHGLAVGEHGFLGKQNMYEHSMRVPFMIVGPELPAGKRISTPIYLQDAMPTTLQLAGIDKPDHVQFHSLLPIIKGDKAVQYESIYGGYVDLQRMVRKGDYKLIVYPKIGIVRLYNVAEDPKELSDLAGSVAMRPVIRDLMEELQKLQKDVGDDLDLTPIASEL